MDAPVHHTVSKAARRHMAHAIRVQLLDHIAAMRYADARGHYLASAHHADAVTRLQDTLRGLAK